jgi:hypothetical protein
MLDNASAFVIIISREAEIDLMKVLFGMKNKKKI